MATEQQQQMSGRQKARIVGFLVVVVVLAALVLDNTRSVRVGFVFFDKKPPLIWVLVVTAALGAVADRLLIWVRRRERD